MILLSRIPARKCFGLVAPTAVVILTGFWYFSVLYFQLQASLLKYQLDDITQQSKSTLGEASYLTRRLSDVSQSWTDTRILLKEILHRTSKERKLVIWGIEEGGSDNDENNLIELLDVLYGVTITSSDVEVVNRIGIYRDDVPRPLLVYVTNEHVKKIITEAITEQGQNLLGVGDNMIQRLERLENTEQACTMRIKSIGEFQVLKSTKESIGSWLTDISPNNQGDLSNNMSNARIWVAKKPFGNRILLEYNGESFATNFSQPVANYTLPYAWGGTGHVVMSGHFYYVRAKSNYIVKYDLVNRRMVRYRQIKGAKFTEKERGASCSYGGVQQSDITLQADEFGLWATYCTDKEGMKLTLLDPESLKVLKLYDTGWRKDWFEAIFVACGVAYAIRRFQSKPFLQVKYIYNTIRGEPNQAHNAVSIPLAPDIYGSIMQLSYNSATKRLAVWTSTGHIGWHDVNFDYSAV